MERPAAGELGAVYRVDGGVRFRIVGGEGVVLHQGNREVLVVSEVGGRVLQLLDGAVPVGEVVARLQEEYEVEEERLRRDVLDFLRQLQEAGVVQVTG